MRWLTMVLAALLIGSSGVPLRADFLYIADTGSGGLIRRTNLDGSDPQTLVSEAGLARSLALDPGGGRIYWTDTSRNGIFRANVDGSNVQQIIPLLPSSGADGGLALDLVHGKIYWTDRDPGNRGIRRANLDGSGIETLISTGLSTIHAITLDVADGKFYFTNVNQIQSANLDGSNVQTVLSGVTSTYGLALDLDAKQIYWSELTSPTGTVRRANFDGTNKQTIVTGLMNPRGIAVDSHDGFVYFTDFTNQSPSFEGFIGRVNLDGSNRQTLDTFPLSFPHGIALGPSSTPVPEPASLVLLGWGVVGIAVYRWGGGRRKGK